MYHTQSFNNKTVNGIGAIDEWLNGFAKEGLRSLVVGYVLNVEDWITITVRTWKPVELDQVKLHSDLRDTFEEPAINLDEGL